MEDNNGDNRLRTTIWFSIRRMSIDRGASGECPLCLMAFSTNNCRQAGGMDFFSFLSESFSALIKSCKISGKPCCFFLCFCIEKCKRTGSCIQSATGIDTWSQHKSDMISCDFSIFQRICSDQFLQSLIFGIFQTVQSFFYQNPVLSLKNNLPDPLLEHQISRKVLQYI